MWINKSESFGWQCSIIVVIAATVLNAEQFNSSRLFPENLPDHQWVSFDAKGFEKKVTGVIFRGSPLPESGVPLGGVDTGCIDLEATGLLGYSTIFNDLFPRQLLNTPLLGVTVGDKTWVLSTGKGKKYVPEDAQTATWPPIDYAPKYFDVNMPGVEFAKNIEYWGHYPIADMVFDTNAPVSVQLRAWSPFVPGNIKASTIPGAIFEISIHNPTSRTQKGTILFNFPGFSSSHDYGPSMQSYKTLVGENKYSAESLTRPWPGCYIVSGEQQVISKIDRQTIKGELNGVFVSSGHGSDQWGMSFVLGAFNEKCRWGKALNLDAAAWQTAAKSLSGPSGNDPGAALAIDFNVSANGSKKTVVILSWSAPYWRSGGAPYLGGQLYKHMYVRYHPDALSTARYLAKNHSQLLGKVIKWQEQIYNTPTLPGWLSDCLINILYLITEDSVWGQNQGPIAWARPEDGVFGMNECPRGCPQIECIPCTFYGGMPITYFFPECALSTLRAEKQYQYEDGRIPWVFGGATVGTPAYDLALPAKGYQTVLNGVCYVVGVDRQWMVTGDDNVLREFWPSLKKCTDFSFSLRPKYGLSQIVAMPEPGSDAHGMGDTEWFEAPQPGWRGYVTHAGGIRMAQARIMRRMAEKMGDQEYMRKCDEWLDAGEKAIEKYLWAGSYYLNFNEPETNNKSDMVFGYQLDGEWLADNHGLPGVFPKDRVEASLATIKKLNASLSSSGVVNYANPDGSPAKVGGYGPYSYFPPELMMLAMTYMYEGQKDYGTELLRRCMENYVCKRGYIWDAPNIMRGDKDTGERHFGADYYQNMMLWLVPAAMEKQDLRGPCNNGGLVDRVIKAGKY